MSKYQPRKPLRLVFDRLERRELLAGFDFTTNPIPIGSINGYDVVVAGDLDGDGATDDLFFRRVSSGENRIAYGNGGGQWNIVTQPIGSTNVSGYPQMVVGDFDSDGRQDDIFLWEPGSGENQLLYGQGASWRVATNQVERGWINGSFSQMVAGDLDRDGVKDDLMFLLPSTGENRIVYGRGNNVWEMLTNPLPTGHLNGYEQLLLGDYNGDGKFSDLFLWTPSTGANRVVFIGGGVQAPWIDPALVNGYTQAVSGDFDNDGRRDDILFQSATSGENRAVYSGMDGFWIGTATIETRPISTASLMGYNRVAAGDFRVDGKENDLLFWEPTSGNNFGAFGSAAPNPPADSEPPILTLPTDMTVEAIDRAGAPVSYSATASDRVDGPVPVSCTLASGQTFPIATTTVNCTASDAHGNMATGSFRISVRDTTPPLLNLPSDLSAEATDSSGAPVRYSVTANDRVDAAVTVNCTPATASTFPITTTVVNCSATDSHGNVGTGSFKVTVRDTTLPLLALPVDITAEATGPAGASVNYVVTASDLVDGLLTLTCTQPSGATFPLGTTPVQCSATDSHGNRAQGTFLVTIRDTTAPKCSVGLLIDTGDSSSDRITREGTVHVTCSDAVGVTAPRVLLDGTPVTLNETGTFIVPNDQLHDGIHTVQVSALDTAGNSVTVTPFDFWLDSVAPRVAVRVVNDTGIRADDFITRDGRIAVDGDGAAVDVLLDKARVTPTGGIIQAITDGPHNVQVTAQDTACNSRSAALDFVLDRVGPHIQTIEPIPGRRGVTNVLVTFDERLDREQAENPFNYTLRISDRRGRVRKEYSPTMPAYNDENHTVMLALKKALRLNAASLQVIVKNLTDLAGNGLENNDNLTQTVDM